MATRLEPYLLRGEIDNLEPGVIRGRLWLIGRGEPITLELRGDAHRDMAGSRLTFENLCPELAADDLPPELPQVLRGTAGDVTASQKIYEVTYHPRDPHGDERTLVNALSIEWYDASGQRFVIDTTEFRLALGAPAWTLDAATEKQQLEANTQRFHDYIARIADRLPAVEPDPSGENRPLDEFEWEARLKESERVTEAYMETLEKYQDFPDQEQLVNAAMGWRPGEWTEGAGADEDHWPGSDHDRGDDDDGDDHPLYQRTHGLSLRLHHQARGMDLLDSDGVLFDRLSNVQQLVFATMELSAKLAGALNGVRAETEPEPGLVVASLKRGLPIVSRALASLAGARSAREAPESWLDAARNELFDIRGSMLDLIQQFRRQLPG